MLIKTGINSQLNIFQTPRIFVWKIIPFIDFSMKQIYYNNQTAEEILTKEISLILPNFPKDKKEKRIIIASLVISFIGLAYEGISSYLHKRRKKHYKKH